MNKKKQPAPRRVTKRIEKEVKKGLKKAATEKPLIARVFPKLSSLLSPSPKKKAQKQEESLTGMLSSMTRKKAKSRKKVAKRASPKEGIVGSTPANPHSEGLRWMKTVQKQTVDSSKKLSKKLSKRKA